MAEDHAGHGDHVIEALSDSTGAGDIVLKTGGQERHRLKSDGTGTGVFGGSLSVFNVKTQYGAVGNGVTDDTAAIVAAINTASAAGGGTVFFPYGTYLYSTINLTVSNFSLEGQPGTTLKSSAPKSTSSPGMWLKGSNITVRGIAFDYTISMNIDTDGATIYANGSNASTLRFGFPGASPTVSDITVKDCKVLNSRNTAYYCVGASNVRFTDNYAQEVGQGFFMGDITGDLILRGNTVRRSLDDMYAVVADSVLATNSRRVVISGNTGFQGYAQGIDTTGVDGCTITDNVIEQTWSAGILSYQYTGVGPTGPSNRTLISNNVVSAAGKYFGVGQYQTAAGSGGNGIRVADVTNCLVTSNLIYNSQVAAFLQQGANTGLIVRGNAGYNPVGASAAPAVPATTVALTNPFNVDATVYVYGGTVSAVKIHGVTAGAAISGPFPVPAGETIAITYTVAPGWEWILH